MAIGSALERGSLVVVFDQHGTTLFSKARGNGPDDGLLVSRSSPRRQSHGGPPCWVVRCRPIGCRVWWSIWWSRWTDGFVMDEQGRKMSKSTVTAQYGSTIYTYD